MLKHQKLKDKQDTEVAVASSNSDNVSYEASATTPATTSSADTDSEDSEKSSKDEDKQNASKSDNSSVEKVNLMRKLLL